MSVRAIWIMTLSKRVNNDERILFSRRYPTVEQRVKTEMNDSYQSLPCNKDIIDGMMVELGLDEEDILFVAARDSCDRLDQKPVFEVRTKDSVIWPFLIIEQYGLLYTCLPYVKYPKDNKRPPLIDIPSISSSYLLLLGLADYISSNFTNPKQQSLHNECFTFLSEACPFGTINDTDAFSVGEKLNIHPHLVSTNKKQPFWKAEVHRGKPVVNLAVIEHIRSVIYNNVEIKDVFTLYGSVTCKAELEGVLPDVTLNLTYSSSQPIVPLDHLHTHPCAYSTDSYIFKEDPIKLANMSPRRIRFVPLNHQFTLCHYTAQNLKKLPITGSYRMKMDKNVANLEVKLYLSDQVRNSFQFCELHLPFHNHGLIYSHNSDVSFGNVSVSSDHKILIWNLGQKFQSKSLEATLLSSVTFTPDNQPTYKVQDRFCTGNNAYAQLRFKMADVTLSGLYLDYKSVHLSPMTKFKLNTAHSLTSGDYKIWNSHGEVLYN